MPELTVGVSGALGSMGRMVCAAVTADSELVLAAAIDPAYAEPGKDDFPAQVPHFSDLSSALHTVRLDVLVDFTRPDVVMGNTLAALEAGVAVVVGTTGLAPADLERIGLLAEKSGRPAFIAPNFALGAVLMMRFAAEAARVLPACEIVELHHPRKVDAPSGTAKRTAELIAAARVAGAAQGASSAEAAGGVPIHSVRLPGLVAHQEVIFGGLGETLTIRHDSLSRECFMPGVLLAVKRSVSLQGLVVGLENIL